MSDWDCPQVGTMGRHSVLYYRGQACEWCGAVPCPHDRRDSDGSCAICGATAAELER